MQTGFFLYTSDSTEELATRYVSVRSKKPDLFHNNDLFLEEVILVPSRGMLQWLKQRMVDQGIITANIRFTSLSDFFSQLFRSAKKLDGFERDTMAWRIVSILSTLAAEFKELDDYIQGGKKGESKELRRYSLAAKIASLFSETYLVECPEMLARSEGGREGNFWNENASSWQAKLWQRLCKDGEIKSPADYMMELLKGDFSSVSETVLSRPVTVWGCNTMPLRQLAALKMLSQKIPVHFFCLNPCDNLWTDDLRRDWCAGSMIKEPQTVEDLFKNNTLLQQWAKHEREYFKYLTDIESLPFAAEKIARNWQLSSEKKTVSQQENSSDKKHQAKPCRNGVLQYLQSNLRGWTKNPKPSSVSTDDTLTIHCCHNELREVEILFDHLLHLIQKHGYSFSDILVAAPDISLFAPSIDAVFGQKINDKSIDYSINGRSMRQSNPIAEAIIQLLDVGRTRYELFYIEKLLNCPAIRSRFHLEESDIKPLLQACEEAGIRWGVDEKHEKYGFADFEDFSWQHGLDRMLLGLALPDDGELEGAWEAAVPYDKRDSPEDHFKLQSLIEFFQALRKVETDFTEACPIKEWRTRLTWLLETFFDCDMKMKADYRGCWNAVQSLCNSGSAASYTDEVPLEVIREALSKTMGSEGGYSNMRGKITFANLRDIRGIPCKVLCLLGMDNGAYPRPTKPDSLNLLEEQLKKEQRTISQQDRYFFLESFLAAHDYLLIYYRGWAEASDKRYYSSTLVSDLRSYAEKLFPELKRDKEQLKAGDYGIEISHLLLPYSHDYFSGSEANLRKLWSFNKANWRIADFLYNRNEENNEGFLEKQRDSFRGKEGFRAPEDLQTQITVQLKELERFLENAGFIFLKKAMEFSKQKTVDEPMPDVEPISLNPLEEWSAIDKMFPWISDTFNSLGENGIDDIPEETLTKLYKRLRAENAFPIVEPWKPALKKLLQRAWIRDPDIRTAWQQGECPNQKLPHEIDFKDQVPRLPDTEMLELQTLKPENSFEEYYADVKLIYKLSNHGNEKIIEKEQGKKYQYISLKFASNKRKYQLKAYLRHLFFNAIGHETETICVWKDGKASKYASIDKNEAKKRLRMILAFYLYGQTHLVPFLCQCSVQAAGEKEGKVVGEEQGKAAGEEGEEKSPRWTQEYSVSSGGGDEYSGGGDDQLDYFTLLWARDEADLRAQMKLMTTLEELAKNVLAGVEDFKTIDD